MNSSSWPPVPTEPGTRHPKAPAPGTMMDEHYSECFGCGSNVSGGLHLRSTAGEGLSVDAEFKVTEAHQGAPGLAHGGVLTTAFDEALGMLNALLYVTAVTGKLETDFLRPVPVGTLLAIHTQVDGVVGRKIYSSATGRTGGPDGETALRARALFVRVGFEHFTKYGAGLPGQHEVSVNP